MHYHVPQCPFWCVQDNYPRMDVTVLDLSPYYLQARAHVYTMSATAKPLVRSTSMLWIEDGS